jgi:TRAP-type C4-dicarboxylate transport system permease small subunit
MSASKQTIEAGAPAAARPAAGRLVVPRCAEAVSELAARVTAFIAVICGCALLCCLLLQVVARYAFNAPLVWTEESAIFLFVWTTMLVASLGVRERFHVRIEFLVRLLPAPLQVALDACFSAAIALFGGVLVSSGRDLVDLVWGNTSPAIQYPMQALYLAVPVSGALMVLHSVARLLGGGPRSAP